MKEKFELGIKYCFDDVLQIEKGAKVEKTNKDKDKYDEIKPIFIIGVPRCGSTLVEKIIKIQAAKMIVNRAELSFIKQ